MESILFTPWRRIRKPVIASLVTLHFLIGALCFAKPPSALLEIAPLKAAIGAYNRYGFAQTWRMFAPPARAKYELGYALRFDGGWSDRLSLQDVVNDRSRGSVILPRGQIRLSNQMRHPNLREDSLDDEPFFRHFFQQLAAYYCFGDGAIPGLRAIRFYSVIHPIEPFFPEEGAAAGERGTVVRAIYHRECDDR